MSKKKHSVLPGIPAMHMRMTHSQLHKALLFLVNTKVTSRLVLAASQVLQHDRESNTKALCFLDQHKVNTMTVVAHTMRPKSSVEAMMCRSLCGMFLKEA